MPALNGGAMRQACIGCRLEQHLDQFLALRGPARLVATCITCRRAKQRSDASSRRSIQLLQDAAAGRLNGTALRPIAVAPRLPRPNPQPLTAASSAPSIATDGPATMYNDPDNHHPDDDDDPVTPAAGNQEQPDHRAEPRQLLATTEPHYEPADAPQLPRLGRPPKPTPTSPTPPRRRGRPPIQGPSLPPRKRGRPPIQGPSLPPPALRKRGRPPMLGPHLPPPPLRKRGRPPLPVPPLSPQPPRRRGRPPGSRNQPKVPPGAADDDAKGRLVGEGGNSGGGGGGFLLKLG